MDKKSIAKLPNLDHFSYRDAERVYEPAEDTYLLCDALLQDIESIVVANPIVIAEVGSGSGCVITYLKNLLRIENGRKVLAFATDLNIDALRMTQLTAKNNNAEVECVQTSFLTALQDRLLQSIDVLIFNPPYVPSEPEELGSSGIEAAWAGGKDGREVIDQFLPLLPRYLSAVGICYLVLVQENKPVEIQQILLDSYGLHSQIVLSRAARNEKLYILKILRKQFTIN